MPTFTRPVITFQEHDPPSNQPFDANNNSLLSVAMPIRSQLVSSDVSLLMPGASDSTAGPIRSTGAGSLVENRRLSDSAALASNANKPKLASFMPTKRCVLRLDGCSYLIGKLVLSISISLLGVSLSIPECLRRVLLVRNLTFTLVTVDSDTQGERCSRPDHFRLAHCHCSLAALLFTLLC